MKRIFTAAVVAILGLMVTRFAVGIVIANRRTAKWRSIHEGGSNYCADR